MNEISQVLVNSLIDYLPQIVFGVCGLVLLIIKLGKKRLRSILGQPNEVKSTNKVTLNTKKKDYFINVNGQEIKLNDQQIYSKDKGGFENEKANE